MYPLKILLYSRWIIITTIIFFKIFFYFFTCLVLYNNCVLRDTFYNNCALGQKSRQTNGIYIIIKSMHALWLVNQLWFIVPVNSWKFRVSSELLYKGNRPQVSMVYRLIKHLGCWKNTRGIHVLPTSRVVYQPINHRNLWSIA